MADIDKLFENVESEILSEEVKLSLAVLFEAQVSEAIKAKEEALLAENAKEVAEFKATLVENLDAYCEHFAEEFIKENKMAIHESVKLKTAERVLKTFDSVMKDFSYQLDEKKVTGEEKLTEAKKEINKLTTQLIESKKLVKESERAAIVMEASLGLDTDLQKTKLVEYAKGIEFDELFEKKTKAFVKTVLSESKVADKKVEDTTQIISEEVVNPVPEKPVSTVDKYLKALESK